MCCCVRAHWRSLRPRHHDLIAVSHVAQSSSASARAHGALPACSRVQVRVPFNTIILGLEELAAAATAARNIAMQADIQMMQSAADLHAEVSFSWPPAPTQRVHSTRFGSQAMPACWVWTARRGTPWSCYVCAGP